LIALEEKNRHSEQALKYKEKKSVKNSPLRRRANLFSRPDIATSTKII
jgi:hypothetical protein